MFKNLTGKFIDPKRCSISDSCIVYVPCVQGGDMGWRIIVLSSLLVMVSARYKYRATVKYYPKNSAFWVTDFFVYGCKTFLTKCAQAYKVQPVCAISYNDEYRNFANYCEMQYENCNTWRNWRIFKREPC